MSNPNNLIRPPILNPPGNGDAGQEQLRPLTLTELAPIMNQIASQVLQQQGPSMVQSTLNPNANLYTISDQTIDNEHRQNLQDMDKIPEVVRSIREFSGDQGEFNSWKKSVERLLKVYEVKKGTPKYYGILSVIRNKIVGDADIALESYNTPLDWSAIIRCLSLHYSDKRDLSTLEYQMNALVQGPSSVQDFYQTVYRHLSLILNKLGSLEVSNESLCLLTQTYPEKALDTFIRGLNGDLPKLLGIREPVDLPQALHLCLKLENQTYRTNYAHNSSLNNRKLSFQTQTRLQPPPLPPRKQRFSSYTRQNDFYPQLVHFPEPPHSPYQL